MPAGDLLGFSCATYPRSVEGRDCWRPRSRFRRRAPPPLPPPRLRPETRRRQCAARPWLEPSVRSLSAGEVAAPARTRPSDPRACRVGVVTWRVTSRQRAAPKACRTSHGWSAKYGRCSPSWTLVREVMWTSNTVGPIPARPCSPRRTAGVPDRPSARRGGPALGAILDHSRGGPRRPGQDASRRPPSGSPGGLAAASRPDLRGHRPGRVRRRERALRPGPGVAGQAGGLPVDDVRHQRLRRLRPRPAAGADPGGVGGPDLAAAAGRHRLPGRVHDLLGRGLRPGPVRRGGPVAAVLRLHGVLGPGGAGGGQLRGPAGPVVGGRPDQALRRGPRRRAFRRSRGDAPAARAAGQATSSDGSSQ